MINDTLALVISILGGLIIFFSWKLYQRMQIRLQTAKIVEEPKILPAVIAHKNIEIPPAEEIAPIPNPVNSHPDASNKMTPIKG